MDDKDCFDWCVKHAKEPTYLEDSYTIKTPQDFALLWAADRIEELEELAGVLQAQKRFLTGVANNRVPEGCVAVPMSDLQDIKNTFRSCCMSSAEIKIDAVIASAQQEKVGPKCSACYGVGRIGTPPIHCQFCDGKGNLPWTAQQDRDAAETLEKD